MSKGASGHYQQKKENVKWTGVTGRHGTEMKRKDQKEMKYSEGMFESKILE